MPSQGIHSGATAKRFRSTRIFDKGVGVMHLDLSIEAGTSVALIGPNGAGKTTALRLVMGMLRPDSGTVETLGEDPRKHAVAIKQQIGYVAEDQVLPSSLRPCDWFSLLQSLYPTWDPERAQAFADRFELPLKRELGHMSRGQRRQVMLIGALVHRPRLLVLDEPAGGLDPLIRRSFMESVIELLAEQGTTVLFASHQLDQVERLAERVVVMRRGKIILDRDAVLLRQEANRLLVEGVTQEQARQLPQVLAAHRRENRIALTILADRAEACALVEETLRGRVLQVRGLDLEELFVELLRGST